jgi:hypothetical protein
VTFWDKLRNRLSPGFDKTERVRISQEGEQLEALVESGHFETLITLVLDPMDRESFEAFKKLEPGDSMGVIQTQKMSQIVDEIKRRVARKIEAGIAARQQILSDSNPQEGERHGKADEPARAV